MPGSRLAERLGDLVALSDAERAALAQLEHRQRSIRRSAILVRENDRAGEMFVLHSGMMMSYALLHDGSRQILRFLFPGDLLAASALAYRVSPETIAALTDCTIAAFERTAIAALMVDHPRLSALLMATGQIERVALADPLAAIGRTSAKARIAGLLLEIRDSLRLADKATDAPFPLGLTQEEIGDATGLTAVHVNRMLRQLEDEGLIERGAGQVSLLDEAALVRVANYVDRGAALDLSWLPPAR